MNEAFLYWHEYRYFPYEKEFAQREVNTLLKPEEVYQTKNGLRVLGDFQEESLKRLVYFQKYKADGYMNNTLQYELEKSCSATGQQKRQSTRYSTHGLHEYKGKFNPQVVRGILNLLDVPSQSLVLDPFCGSGTTLVECFHSKMRVVGFDMNPLGVFISNAKLLALSTPVKHLRILFEEICQEFKMGNKSIPNNYEDERHEYLLSWFTPQVLVEIERLKEIINIGCGELGIIFLVLASDLLRDYSLQEPADLRIRRRRTPLPHKPFIEAFQHKTSSFLENLELVQKAGGPITGNGQAYIADSRKMESTSRMSQPFDAVITSPPYATALPYIDTQRLSLIWLTLCSPREVKQLEAELTGSREFVKGEKETWRESLQVNQDRLPDSIYKFCLELESALADTDGFRRQAVPALMYRYFSDMQAVFSNLLHVTKDGAPFALVIGHNHTTLGGEKFSIDTPILLKDVAESSGWQYSESIPLQTYQRYSIHSNNAVQAETLLILRKL